MSDTAKAKHPKGLYVLFGTEMWERFSFYGMRALLVLYLTKAVGLNRNDALEVYGTYLLLVYLMGLLGGSISDQILGSRKAIFTGGIVMMCGQFLLMWPEQFYYGLGLIIAGNAFFKPNISTIVSGLYGENDNRRDGAFTIFYMGINLGAFLAMIAGYIGETYSFGYGFATAGVGMIFALAMFYWGQPMLGTAGFPPGRTATEGQRLEGKDFTDILIWAVGISVVVIALVTLGKLVGPLVTGIPSEVKLLIGVVILFAAIFGLMKRSAAKAARAGTSATAFTTEEWQQVAVVIIISIFVIFFWAGFEQAGGTLNLFADEKTDRVLFGWTVPATAFQSLNPFFIIALGMPAAMLWDWQDKKKWGLSTPAKMAMGMIVLGLGFVVMYFGQQQADTQGKAAMFWLVAVYFLHTLGELCLSPIGLSLVTKLSPARIVSLMMGVWFACTAVADYASQRLEYVCHTYHISLWVTLIASSFGAGVLLLALTPLLKKWMHGKG